MGIRSRLMLLLVVPLVGLLAVTGYAMATAVQQSRDAAKLSGNAEVSLASYDLIDAMQAERKVLAAGQPTTDELRGAVTAASDRLRALADEQGGALDAMADRALARVEAAGSLALTNTGGLVAVDGYSPAIADLLDVSRAGFDPQGAIDDGAASTADLLASAQEAGAKERDLVQALAIRGSLAPEVYAPVSELAAAQDIQSTQAAATASEDLTVRIDRVGDALAAASRGRDSLFFAAVDGTVVDQAAVDQWLSGADARVEDLTSLRDDAAGQAVARVDDLGTSSRRVLLLAAAALIAVVLVSAVLVRSAIRSIARPLRELATQAEEVAMVRLPEAVRSQQTGTPETHLPIIRATGAGEVQEVASAFNDVQDTALRLAGEQAVLRRNLADALTNLGRRNQALLGRQLDFISSLEQRETDPAFLEHLFKLDHLASRMRRNAESLLILTGSETPRRRRKPAPLSEVVRAAMSEVEDFERVRLGQLGDATLTGPVVIDLVHMLAELIENALRFSPPDTTVEIDGRSLGQGGYQLAVIDHGVGMADVEIVAANQRLAGLDEVDGMPTRYLGQYVIAKLAAKTGAMVRLQPTAGGRGVTAVVSLPASATVGGADRSSIARPLPGTRAARDQSPDRFAPGAGLTAQVVQPETVIDPAADPFADAPPTREDLVVDPAAASEDWTWMPDVAPTDPAPTDAAPFDSTGTAVVEANGAIHPVADEWSTPTDEWSTGTVEAPADEWSVPAVDSPAEPAAGGWTTPDGEWVDPAHAPTAEPVDEWAALRPTDDADVVAVDDAELIDAGHLIDEDAPIQDGALIGDGSPIEDGSLIEGRDERVLLEDGAIEASAVDAAEDAPSLVDEPAGDDTRFLADPFGDPTPGLDQAEPTEPSAPAFSAEDFAAGILAADTFGGAPPPPPAAIPDQTWDARPEPAEPEPVAEAPTWTAPAADTPAVPTFAPESPAPAASAPSAGGPGGGLGGGLTRRVPGASLQDSPLGQAAPEPVEERDRSADGVRSMLSAFQGGRSRGRGGVALEEPAAASIGTAERFGTTASPDAATSTAETTPTPSAPDPSSYWAADHHDVEETSELEDPRDH
jgi:signal transduction histidine kinase